MGRARLERAASHRVEGAEGLSGTVERPSPRATRRRIATRLSSRPSSSGGMPPGTQSSRRLQFAQLSPGLVRASSPSARRPSPTPEARPSRFVFAHAAIIAPSVDGGQARPNAGPGGGIGSDRLNLDLHQGSIVPTRPPDSRSMTGSSYLAAARRSASTPTPDSVQDGCTNLDDGRIAPFAADSPGADGAASGAAPCSRTDARRADPGGAGAALHELSDGRSLRRGLRGGRIRAPPRRPCPAPGRTVVALRARALLRGAVPLLRLQPYRHALAPQGGRLARAAARRGGARRHRARRRPSGLPAAPRGRDADLPRRPAAAASDGWAARALRSARRGRALHRDRSADRGCREARAARRRGLRADELRGAGLRRGRAAGDQPRAARTARARGARGGA